MNTPKNNEFEGFQAGKEGFQRESLCLGKHCPLVVELTSICLGQGAEPTGPHQPDRQTGPPTRPGQRQLQLWSLRYSLVFKNFFQKCHFTGRYPYTVWTPRGRIPGLWQPPSGPGPQEDPPGSRPVLVSECENQCRTVSASFFP